MGSPVGRWLEVVDRYYLSDFVASGGSAFKLLLTQDEDQTQEALSGLRDLADKHGYFYAQISAAKTRIDLIQEILFEVARQVDWLRLAERDAADLIKALGYVVPNNVPLTDLRTIARTNGVEESDIRLAIHRATEREIAQDRDMCKDFRVAMMHLRASRFFETNVTPTEADTLVGWLRGEKVGLAALRRLGIYSRIDRHNARDMLNALTHWLVKSGNKGVLICTDLAALLCDRRPMEPEGASLHYPRARFLDACEVLRQFIDDTDELTHCLLCCVGPNELETHEKQSFFRYRALAHRLIDEVRDLNRPNPLAAMVRATDLAQCPEANPYGR